MWPEEKEKSSAGCAWPSALLPTPICASWGSALWPCLCCPGAQSLSSCMTCPRTRLGTHTGAPSAVSLCCLVCSSADTEPSEGQHGLCDTAVSLLLHSLGTMCCFPLQCDAKGRQINSITLLIHTQALRKDLLCTQQAPIFPAPVSTNQEHFYSSHF